MEYVNKITGYVLALVLGAILVGGLLIPTVQAITETEKTFVNEGYFFVDKIASTDADTHTLSWDSATPTIMTVDDIDLDMTTWGLNDSQMFSIFMTENNVLRARYDGSSVGVTLVEVHGSTASYADATSSMSASIVGGTATITMDTDAPKTITYSDAYVISSDESDYVMKKMNESAYVHDDTVIYGIGNTSIKNGNSSTYCIMKVTGTMSNMTASVLYPTSGVTTSNIVVDYTDSNIYSDLNEFRKVTFDATINSTTTECIYSYLVVPAEITAEKALPLDSTEIAMFGVISILGIVALVVVAANSIRTKY